MVPSAPREQAAHKSSPPADTEGAGLNEKGEQAGASTLTEPYALPAQPKHVLPKVAEPQVSLDELARGRN